MTTATAPPLQTEHVFEYRALLERPLQIGRGPSGTRVFWQSRGGTLTGPGLNGEVLAGGGDWALTGGDGWTRVDVRGQVRTEDGAILYLSYGGVIEPTEALARAIATGGETSFDDHYWRVALTIETGDPRYAWLTQSLLIGRGRICSGPGVAYQVSRVS
jgi:hypothetical protein